MLNQIGQNWGELRREEKRREEKSREDVLINQDTNVGIELNKSRAHTAIIFHKPWDSLTQWRDESDRNYVHYNLPYTLL